VFPVCCQHILPVHFINSFLQNLARLYRINPAQSGHQSLHPAVNWWTKRNVVGLTHQQSLCMMWMEDPCWWTMLVIVARAEDLINIHRTVMLSVMRTVRWNHRSTHLPNWPLLSCMFLYNYLYLILRFIHYVAHCCVIKLIALLSALFIVLCSYSKSHQIPCYLLPWCQLSV